MRGVASPGRTSLGLVVLALVASSASARAAGREAISPRFKILVDEDAVYSVRFEDLIAAGLPQHARPPTNRLGMTHRGQPVPIWVDDGGDGRFGPADRVEFVGTHPRGRHSHSDPHTRFDVYYLELDAARPRRVAAQEATACGTAADLVGIARLEENTLRARFPGASRETDEIWYWARLSHADREPTEVVLDLPGLDPSAARDVTLTLHFRGWSSSRRPDDAFDHRVDVELGDRQLGAAEWNNAPGGYVWRAAPIAAERLRESGNRLRLRIPVRRVAGAADPLIDALLLNWIEVRYPLTGVPAQGAFWVDPGTGDCLPARVPGSGVLYGPDGVRFVAPLARPSDDGAGWLPRQPGRDQGLTGPYLVADARGPAEIRVDRPSALADGGEGADYLIVAHPLLLEVVRPLAELHRSRGMRVALADVEDVYDEFSHGIPSPVAIRDLVRHARRHWPPPAPRFLLLVGDASWDVRSDELRDERYADWTFRGQPSATFVKNSSTKLARPGHRGLVPTWSSPTYEGDAASDNYFVAVEGDDELPDLAVGRLPAATPEEARAMVEKTMAQHRAAPGPWRRRVLWLTNEQKRYQKRSDRMIRLADERGLVSTRIYPAAEEPSNEMHQAGIRRAFDAGQAIVHFVGHGGRYIWRTGPPNFEKDHDLFTLEDLDKLAPSSRLPVVLSMTCYSAPFDHPTADSIGEKLLRLPGRGAAAVLAASWRNSPNRRIDSRLMQEVMAGGTIGEALLRAKRATGNLDFARQYNLLGDPALPIPLPRTAVDVQLVADEPSRIVARVAPSVATRRGVVEWVDGAGRVLYSTEAPPESGIIEAAFHGPPEQLAQVAVVRVYAWGMESGAEAVGAVLLDPPGGSDVAAASRPSPGSRKRD